MISISVNGKVHEVDVAPATPLLWVLRDTLGLTGTKYGCGISQCGACTVHVDGVATRTCVTPISSVEGSDVTTIEGLSTEALHPIQQAWLEDDVVQCGYCQSGQIMSAAELLATNQEPSDQDIDTAMSGNICRCGTYGRIRCAIKKAAAAMRGEEPSARAQGKVPERAPASAIPRAGSTSTRASNEPSARAQGKVPERARASAIHSARSTSTRALNEETSR